MYMEYRDAYQSRKSRPECEACLDFRPTQVRHVPEPLWARFSNEHYDDCVAVAQARHDNPRRLADAVRSLVFDAKKQPV